MKKTVQKIDLLREAAQIEAKAAREFLAQAEFNLEAAGKTQAFPFDHTMMTVQCLLIDAELSIRSAEKFLRIRRDR